MEKAKGGGPGLVAHGCGWALLLSIVGVCSGLFWVDREQDRKATQAAVDDMEGFIGGRPLMVLEVLGGSHQDVKRVSGPYLIYVVVNARGERRALVVPVKAANLPVKGERWRAKAIPLGRESRVEFTERVS